MPYGLIPLGASIILTGLYLFTEAAGWSKVLVVGLLLVSLAAWLGTAPVVAWHMGRFSTLSLAANCSSLCI